MINIRHKYPLISIPEKIANACNSLIPITLSTQEPELEKKEAIKPNYQAAISLAVVSVLILFYLIPSIPSNNAITVFLIVLLGVATGFAIIEMTNNKTLKYINSLENRRHSMVLDGYIDDLREVKNIENKNADAKTVNAFRKGKVKKILQSIETESFPLAEKKEIEYQDFYEKLKTFFPEELEYNRFIKSGDNDMEIIPNFILNFTKSNLNIAIFVDVPYSLETREIKNYFDINDGGKLICWFDKENSQLNSANWIAVRFAEIQAVKNPESCCKTIAALVEKITGSDYYYNLLEKVPELETLNLWSKEQCLYYAANNYRESYLPEPKVETPQPQEEEISQEEKDRIAAQKEKEEKEKAAAELFQKAEDLHKENKWEELLDCCNKIIELKPDFQAAYLHRSSALGNLDRFDEAAKDCEKAIELNPEDANAHYNLGIANLKLKRNQEAINNLNNAVSAGISNQGDIFMMIANTYLKLSNSAKYREYLQKAAEFKNPDAKNILENIKENISDKNVTTKINTIGAKTVRISDGITDIAFSPNDDYLAVAGTSRTLKVFSKDWKTVFETELSALSLAFNEKFLAAACLGVIKIFKAEDNFSVVSEINFSLAGIKKMFFHPTKENMLYVTDNFQVWEIHIFAKTINKVLSNFKITDVTKDRQILIGKDYFNTIKMFSCENMQENFSQKLEQGTQVKAMTVNQERSRLIIGDKSGKMKVFNPSGPALIGDADFESEISDIEIGNGYYAVITNNRKLHFINTLTGQKGKEIQLQNLPKLMKISNKNNLLALGNFNGNLDILQIEETDT